MLEAEPGVTTHWRTELMLDQGGHDAATEIIEAAGQQFALNGFAGTSFSRIADAMGKPKSAIGYHLFPSKQSIANAVITEQQKRWRELDSRVPDEPGLKHLLTLMLTAAIEGRNCPVAAGAIRLLREFRKKGVSVPELFDWHSVATHYLAVEPAWDSSPDAGTLVDLLLNATFGVFDGSTSGSDETFEQQLKALWSPLLLTAGMEGAPEVIELLRPIALHSGCPPEENTTDSFANEEEIADAYAPSQIREWARDNGFEVASRGRIKDSMVRAFYAANRSRQLS